MYKEMTCFARTATLVFRSTVKNDSDIGENGGMSIDIERAFSNSAQ